MFNKYNQIGFILIGVTVLAATIGISLIDPVAQDPSYHNFADIRKVMGIPNFWNVVSNFAFMLVGLFGLCQLISSNQVTVITEIRSVYFFLFGGVALVAFGSGYYHLWPDNRTLVWDRLPMTVTFMALFCIVIAEYISITWAKRLFIPLALASAGSVLFWYFGELNGQGDLRAYILVQFLPILLIPIMLLCFPSKFSHGSVYWLLLVTYIFAKFFEHFDGQVFTTLGFISGHSLKHLMAAVGLYLLLRAYQTRTTHDANDT